MRVLITDDDRLVCASLKTILEAEKIEVLGVGNSAEDAVKLYDALMPDVLLMDIRMGGMTGLEAAHIILKKHPQAKILFLTTFTDDEYIVKALMTGAKGYLLKQNFESIVPSLRAVYNGQNVFGDEIINRLPDLIGEMNKIDLKKFDISDKEYEIIALVAEGLSNKEIAHALYLSEGTVRNYMTIILDKLDLRDRTQLAIFYYKKMKGA